MALEIKVADEGSWEKRLGRAPKPFDEALLATLRSAKEDGKLRKVVLPNAETDGVMKEIQRHAAHLGISVRKQVQQVDDGYDRILFKVTKKIYRTRSES